jgi:drug/metabolite transporter (DMT)-like permease
MFIPGEIFALGAAICWAVGPLFAYRGVEALGVFRFSQFRFLVSSVILFAIAMALNSPGSMTRQSIMALVASGVIGIAIGEGLLFKAVYYLGPRIASIIFSLHAPITAFAGAAIFGERMTPNSILGVVLAVSGVGMAIVYRSRSERAGGEWHRSGKFEIGIVAAAGAVVCQVIGALLSKEAMGEVHPIFGSFLRTVSAAIAFIPLFVLFQERDRQAKLADMKHILYSSAVSTVGGMTLLLAAFAYSDIHRAAVISSLSPVLFILIMSLVRNEKFSLGAWGGTSIAFTGVFLTIWNF